jgi:hypothetical protein
MQPNENFYEIRFSQPIHGHADRLVAFASRRCADKRGEKARSRSRPGTFEERSQESPVSRSQGGISTLNAQAGNRAAAECRETFD